MSLVRILVVTFFGVISFVALAQDSLITCESYEDDVPAKIQFRLHRPGQYEALSMALRGRDVMDDHFSVFNHMGLILFRAENGIEFNAFEFNDEFYVTVPAFGGEPLTVSRGKCRTE